MKPYQDGLVSLFKAAVVLCVCVCARERVHVCVCVCVCGLSSHKQTAAIDVGGKGLSRCPGTAERLLFLCKHGLEGLL